MSGLDKARGGSHIEIRSSLVAARVDAVIAQLNGSGAVVAITDGDAADGTVTVMLCLDAGMDPSRIAACQSLLDRCEA